MEELTTVLKEEKGNLGAIRILTILRVMTLAAMPIPPAILPATVSLVLLSVAIKCLQGDMDPDKIDLKKLFVKSPDEALREMGIAQEEIDDIIAGK